METSIPIYCLKFICVLVTILCLNTLGYCQNKIDDLWRSGSAKQLKGKVFTVVCFVSAGKHSWKTEDKQVALFKMREAFKWLQEQATAYGVKVDFYDTATELQEDIKIDKIYQWEGEGKDTGNLGKKVLHAAGYKDLKVLYDSLMNYTHCDNIQVLIFPKIAGRSHAQNYRINPLNMQSFLEWTSIYETDYRGNEIRTSTIAHEVLHLFGAWDLYQSYNQQIGVEEKSKSILNRSIMLETQKGFEGKMVDAVTAYLIGWTTTYYPFYELFRPKSSH